MAPPKSLADGTHNCVWELGHVRKLPEAERALALLKEIKLRIDPLLKARGLRVKKLYEICCCTSGGTDVRIGGFCCPAGDKQTSLRIALRLRQPSSHTLLPFGRLLAVMIHEVTHIVFSAHSASFYAAMDELKLQHRQLEEKGMLLDSAGFPLQGGQRVDPSRCNPASLAEAKAHALRAAEARAQRDGGGRLGGDGGGGWRALNPREAAVRAAERRLADAADGLGEAELSAMLAPIELSDDSDGDDRAAAGSKSQSCARARAGVTRDVARGQIERRTTSGSAQLLVPPSRKAAALAPRQVIEIDLADTDDERSSSVAAATRARSAAAPPSQHEPAKRRREGASSQPIGVVVDLISPPLSPERPARPSAAREARPAAAAAEGGARSLPAASGIQWGKRGENRWQAMCPVCGPVCVGANHGADDPPPQDEDEGAPPHPGPELWVRPAVGSES